jgi:CRP-like cAMP-binding protein
MANFFVKNFTPSVRLSSIQEQPIENGQKYLTELFQHYGVTDTKKITTAISYFKPRIYKKNTFFLKQSETSTKLGFIIYGAVEAFYLEDDGKSNIVMLLTEEDFFTDLRSFLHQQPSSLNMRFTEDTIAMEVSYEDFSNFIQTNLDFSRAFMKIMVNVISAVNEHNMLLKMPTKNKYEYLLKMKPEVFNRFLLQHVASFLGVKQETLSRIRSSYKRKQPTVS